ncbi:hypothetical protein H696_00133 [Fonticula alba]|uniref:Intron-binding protein aquarius n=1 Tax=Fonticula alba TaxID=691883 RepID=A0A058ZF15_FONAL|nr:hypothetical protein H696_00133 [Fonticula alba]KCV72541.1 hypothetical protein H696_00133 [Fonticula alba]|eukprot:XP_009492242.1 hypothetical protein H696_00133 [Fonticula alba]
MASASTAPSAKMPEEVATVSDAKRPRPASNTGGQIPRSVPAAMKLLGRTRESTSAGPRRGYFALTARQIDTDPLTRVSLAFWSPHREAGAPADFSPALVKRIFHSELAASNFSPGRLIPLEFSQYLERFLWPHFDAATASKEHLFSVVLMVNEKFRQSVSEPWAVFGAEPSDKFTAFFQALLRETLSAQNTLQIRSQLLLFLTRAFQSLENPLLRAECLKLVSMGIWVSLEPARREFLLARDATLAKRWSRLERALKKSDDDKRQQLTFERTFLSALLKMLASLVSDIDTVLDPQTAVVEALGAPESDAATEAPGRKRRKTDDAAAAEAEPSGHTLQRQLARSATLLSHAVVLVCRVLELFVDLLGQMPTRRFTNALLDDHLAVVLCQTSQLFAHGATDVDDEDGTEGTLPGGLTPVDARLFRGMVQRLAELARADIVDDLTGAALSADAAAARHGAAVGRLQAAAFALDPEGLRELALGNLSRVSGTSAALRRLLQTPVGSAVPGEAGKSPDSLWKRTAELARRLGLRTHFPHTGQPLPLRTLVEALVLNFAADVASAIREADVEGGSLLPSEVTLWGAPELSDAPPAGDRPLPLPRLNLQFLTIQDYLQRNFHLFRLEAAADVRQDIETAVRRLSPRLAGPGASLTAGGAMATVFGGWSRMAIPIETFTVEDVGPPRVADHRPEFVRGRVSFDLGRCRLDVRQEWDALRQGDVLFLVTVRARSTEAPVYQPPGTPGALPFPEQFGVVAVRGCMVTGFSDHFGDEAPPQGQTGGGGGGGPFDPRQDVPPRRRRGLRRVNVLLDPDQYYADAQRQLASSHSSRRRARAQRRRTQAGLTAGGGDDDAAAAAARQLLDAGDDVYSTFNILVRRKPQENHFRATLATMRDMMEQVSRHPDVVPDWLQDVFLGYGDPRAAHALTAAEAGLPVHPALTPASDATGQAEATPADAMELDAPSADSWLDFRDTFLDLDHLFASFPGREVLFDRSDLSRADQLAVLAARVAAKDFDAATIGTLADPANAVPLPGDTLFRVRFDGPAKQVHVRAYHPPPCGPYPADARRRNAIRFTPTQVRAIRQGLERGLTLVVGPPGTGKTDVAVQLLASIYHNWPNQHILLVTHSNQALNQLFEKIIALDVYEGHCLRLGHGEEDLASDRDFSISGRVNFFLARRLALLAEVSRLAVSLQVPGHVGYTCETASNFFRLHVGPRWDRFRAGLASLEAELGRQATDSLPLDLSTASADVLAADRSLSEYIRREFPFAEYFADAPEPVFGATPAELTAQEAWTAVSGCFVGHLEKVFRQLADIRAFELLRTGRERGDYILMKEARIVAMTCTHAALKRADLLRLGFRYDTVLMEESAQILEIEAFIPLLLQDPQDGRGRLRRIVAIGDHNQLPPVVKNQAFRQQGNMEQSMFTRLVRLGVGTVDLDAQGRARSSLRALYGWRYQCLGDLPHVVERPEFRLANAGFATTAQFIDVGDLHGQGETEPAPAYIQNLAEAEYVVAVFQYMRLLGYPGHLVSILTTYNGQKDLITELVRKRCASNPLFGMPGAISTVDQYQGQQNDYVLLSLVRTKTVGYMRDVRRMVVALSRARLGLYVFGRRALFEGSFELRRMFQPLFEASFAALPVAGAPATDKLAESEPEPEPEADVKLDSEGEADAEADAEVDDEGEADAEAEGDAAAEADADMTPADGAPALAGPTALAPAVLTDPFARRRLPPSYLVLTKDEIFPTTRPDRAFGSLEAPPSRFVIKNVVAMGEYVHQLATEQIRQYRAAIEAARVAASSATDGAGVAAAPGADLADAAAAAAALQAAAPGDLAIGEAILPEGAQEESTDGTASGAFQIVDSSSEDDGYDSYDTDVEGSASEEDEEQDQEDDGQTAEGSAEED